MENKDIDERFGRMLRNELRELLLKMFENGATIKDVQPLINRAQFTLEEVRQQQRKVPKNSTSKVTLPPRNPNRRPTIINTHRTDAIRRLENKRLIHYMKYGYWI